MNIDIVNINGLCFFQVELIIDVPLTASVVIQITSILGFTFVKEKCMLCHVCWRSNSAKSFIRRSNARYDGLHWVVEDCGGEKSSLHWYEESRENTKIIATSTLSFCQVELVAIDDMAAYFMLFILFTVLLMVVYLAHFLVYISHLFQTSSQLIESRLCACL